MVVFISNAIVVNTLKAIKNCRHFISCIFKRLFLIENILNLLKILLKFAVKGQINNFPALQW